MFAVGRVHAIQRGAHLLADELRVSPVVLLQAFAYSNDGLQAIGKRF
jgi:hypothetical protein